MIPSPNSPIVGPPNAHLVTRAARRCPAAGGRWGLVLLAWLLSGWTPAWADGWQVGVAKLDITPTEPLRLSGYAVREQPHSGVADPLHVRVLTLCASQNDSPRPLVLVSIDSIGITSRLTSQVADWLHERHAIPRSHLVLSSTHSHTAPQLPGGLQNLFRVELSADETAAAERYLETVIDATCRGIDQALESAWDGARVEIGQTTAHFGVHRRVIRDGQWAGFGIQPDGQTDPRVRLLRVTAADGRLLAAAYQYACHCTSLGPEFNQISGDWAGLSASRLEELHPGACFLPMIGCGGDINPNPRTSYEAAQRNALEMVDAIAGTIATPHLTPLGPPTHVQFGLVGLEPEHPTGQQLQDLADSSDVCQQRWARHMQQIRRRMGRLPESCPMPVHVWTFGDQLTWVFLGGEVVVDYQFTLEKEFSSQHTWVAAYCNDVVGYVASERQRGEGGYEVDYSMIYYLQPGRWKSGTQSNILTRVREISRQPRGEDQPLDPQAALQSMHVPDGYRIELVASEPLVQDPVNVAFGWDGRVWVVQMSDYPQGTAGGSVRVLRDSDGDGRLDQSQLFLDGLSFPTSAYPWRDGALVIAAPHILFARDTTGDGLADHREVLISGIAPVNPQHRASGFELGLDGRLHFAVGDGTRELVSHRNGQTYRVAGHDVVWNPDTGEIENFVNGKTQFVPARDAFGNWFGNHNSEPMYQFVFHAADLDGQSVDTGSVQHLLTPAAAPPVFPRSRTVDRFNDLYTRDRYTSACSAIIVRTDGLRAAGSIPDSSRPIGLICEPVHNLVARVELFPEGSVFSARRHPEDAEFDFLASTDPWSRPVRVVNAPDGSVWVLDMYRHVIEHPQWIPLAWQERVDIRGGTGWGRIYRIHHRDHRPGGLTDWTRSEPLELLLSPNGAVRDLAVQAIVTDQYSPEQLAALRSSLGHQLRQPLAAEVTASLLGVMAAKGWLEPQDLAGVLQRTGDPQLIRYALRLSTGFDSPALELTTAVQALPARNLGAAVDLQWILSSRRWNDVSVQPGLLTILSREIPDRWLNAALTLVDSPQLALPVLRTILSAADREPLEVAQLQDQLPTVRRLTQLLSGDEQRELCREFFAAPDRLDWSATQLLLLVALSGQSASPAATIDGLDQAVALATQSLLQPHGPPHIRERLSLLLGNQVIDAGREAELIRELLQQGGWAATLALRRLRHVPVDELADALLAGWTRLDSQQHSLAASAMLVRPAWRDALLGGLESAVVEPAQLPPAVVQSLSSHYDRNLRSRAIAVFGRPSPRQAVVSDYLERMPNPATHGDPTRGEQWYREHCAVCHAPQPNRSAVGPPVDNLSHWNNEQWLSAVLDPSQAVEEKFKQSILLTVDQEVVSGVVVEESATYIRIVGNDGNVRQLIADEIEDRKLSNLSLMPDGFEARLSPEQLADIIKYLTTR